MAATRGGESKMSSLGMLLSFLDATSTTQLQDGRPQSSA